MLSDHLCAISWRTRPKSFVGLMTLYESNYIRLGWLVPDTRRLAGRQLSAVEGDCPLELAVLERAPYTTTLALSYLFEQDGEVQREPGLELRVYHDARLAEATAVHGTGCHPGLRRIASSLPRTTDSRWSCNMLLNKWLEYCCDRGHRFTGKEP